MYVANSPCPTIAAMRSKADKWLLPTGALTHTRRCVGFELGFAAVWRECVVIPN